MQSFILSFSFLLLFSIGSDNKEKIIKGFQNNKQNEINTLINKNCKQIKAIKHYSLMV